MSIEKIVKAFSLKKGYVIDKNSSGFDAKRGEREELSFDSANGRELFFGMKSFSSTDIAESCVYVDFTPKARELLVSVRYGCLRDYLHQLSSSDTPLLIDLQKKLETQLERQHLPMDWIEHSYTDFFRFDIYHILNAFYP